MRLQLKALIITLTIFFFINAFANEAEEEQFLPIELTPEEMLRLDEIGEGHLRTPPPPEPIRNCAEWEPSEGVLIRWPLGISIALVAEMSEDLMVTTIVSSTYYMNQAIASYSSGGVNMDNTNFLIASTNSIWTRDYGPWFIFDGRDSFAIVDQIYNRPRPLDDQIPWILGADWGLEVYGMDLVHAGGNHMSNGLGMSMSTRLVYDENPDKTHREIDSIMYAYLNNDYTVLEYIESGGIHHIDCWAKFLSPSTILIKDVPPSSGSYHLLNARADYLAQQTSAWGQNYNIVRVYCPYGTAYTNSIILNDKVLVPIFGSAWDDSALATYAEAMPGYEILGFTGSWYDNDAIHCRAMGVPDRGMLFVDHIPLSNTGNSTEDYEIKVKIKDYSGAGLIPDSLKLFYKTKSSVFTYTYLEPMAGPDSFIAYIPPQTPGTNIAYYIQAADSSGRVETHPYIGAPWAHEFSIVSNAPPEIISPDTLVCQTSEEFAYYPEIIDPDNFTHDIVYEDYPAWLTVQNDSLLGTAPESYEWSSFTVYVSDPYTTTDQTVNIKVNAAPGITSLDSLDCVAGEAFSYCPEFIDPDDSVHQITYNDYPDWLSIQNDSLIGTAPDLDTVYEFTASVADPYIQTSQLVHLYIYTVFVCGDVNDDDDINILDITYLINYLYKEGPAPSVPEAADVDNSGEINILDITYIISFLYKEGPEPDCP